MLNKIRMWVARKMGWRVIDLEKLSLIDRNIILNHIINMKADRDFRNAKIIYEAKKDK